MDNLKTRHLLLQTFDKNKKSKIFEATDTNKGERGQKQGQRKVSIAFDKIIAMLVKPFQRNFAQRPVKIKLRTGVI